MRINDRGTPEERFWNKVMIAPFHSCWEWIGEKSDKGYGRFYCYKGESGHKGYQYAHRFSLSLVKQTHKGLVIDHICRNKGCVNPAHLREVTTQKNTLENSDGIAARNKLKTRCIHGHEFTEQNTKKRKMGGRDCRECIKISSKKYKANLKWK